LICPYNIGEKRRFQNGLVKRNMGLKKRSATHAADRKKQDITKHKGASSWEVLPDALSYYQIPKKGGWDR